MKKTNLFTNGVIWFGAAVSIAEIEAGLQTGANWSAVVLGHLFGGLLLFLAGLLGARSGRNAMETTESTFGSWGMRFFALANVVQLVGWTAVMLAQGAAALGPLMNHSSVYLAVPLALLVAVWIFIGLGDKWRLTTVGMVLLAALSVVITIRLAGLPVDAAAQPHEPLAFWAAFEVSAAMPLSWLPLISDYTKNAERPLGASAVSAGVYTVVSIWMYALGALLNSCGAADFASGLVRAGQPLAGFGLVVVVLSTVTTTFLDAYSSGESAKSLCGRLNPKLVGVAVCALGAVLAVCGIMDRYLDFLYLIASVFAPMAAVLLVDRYLVKRRATWWNLFAWLAGTLTYQFAGSSPIGPTLTAILVSAVLSSLVRLVPRPSTVS